MDEGERGDDEDDAGRCRSDARGQPSTAFAAAERAGGTVARAGVDITDCARKNFPNRPFLSLPEMEAAPYPYPGRSLTLHSLCSVYTVEVCALPFRVVFLQ